MPCTRSAFVHVIIRMAKGKDCRFIICKCIGSIDKYCIQRRQRYAPSIVTKTWKWWRRQWQCWYWWKRWRRWWWWTYLPISQSWQPLVKMSARELEPKRHRDYPICWFASIMLIFQFADWSSIIFGKYYLYNIKHHKNCECCPGHYLSTSVY